jgi:16S rRNA (adenine1518-N6/adenine1519-N6)-dimethyltransferase
VHGRITDKVSVSPEAFFPRPKVRSTILKIELFAAPRVALDELAALRRIVRAAFGQRRKILSNALAAVTKRRRDEVEEFLRAQDIDPTRRGETLTVDEFIKLARAAGSQSILGTED